MTESRTYRFAPRDKTGWVLGLSGSQVVALGASLLLALFASSRTHVALAVIPVLLGSALAFGRVGGQPVLIAAGPVGRWVLRAVRHRNRWEAPDRLLGIPVGDDGATEALPLPPPMDGQVLLAVDGARYDPLLGEGSLAVVHDPLGGTYTAVIPVAGSQFALTESDEQDRLLSLWGEALAGFCRDRSPVVAVRWLEWSAPGGLDEQLAYLDEHGHGDRSDPAFLSYWMLLARAGPMANHHEVLVTVTVAAERVVARRRHDGDERAACTEALLGQLRLFVARLETAGLVVDGPLSPDRLVAALQTRLRPRPAAGGDEQPRTLAQRTGMVSGEVGWPTRSDAARSQWMVDGTLHRCFYVAEWPRLDVGAAWMQPLTLWAGAIRTLAVIYEAVPPRRSLRAIERDATKLASDEEHRRSKGFRISAQHRRAQADVEERETQLASGFGEFAYAGLVTVSATDPDSLDRACDDLIQVAAGCAMVLQQLDFRHDQGVAACLPLARALAPSRAC